MWSPPAQARAVAELDGLPAVVGVDDHILGQAIKAVVTIRAGSRTTKADILKHCSKHLEDFMVPRVVAALDSASSAS